MSPKNHSSKLEKCNFNKNAFKDKLIEVIELRGYDLEGCNSKTF